MLAVLLSATGLLHASEHDVLVLHSYSQEYPWTASQHKGFTSVYSSRNNKSNIRTEYLDSKRNTFNKEYATWFADYLKKKYENFQPDIIYVTDDNALEFSLEHFDGLFPDVPVIFSGVNNYKILNRLHGKNITGVFEQKEISPNLSLIELIDPGNSEILIVGDQSNTSKSIKEEIRKQLVKFSHIKAHFISSNDVSHILNALRDRKEKFVLLTTIGSIKDQAGRILSINEILEQIAQSGERTIISMEDAYMGDGILGGFVTSGKKQGEAAGQMILNYFKGIPVKDIIPLIKSPNEYLFNYKELEKLNIILPDKIQVTATFINKPENFFQRNRVAIIISFIVLLVLLISSMLIFLIILKLKNTDIKNKAGLLLKQAETLKRAKNSLAAYQKISSVGNWEWDTRTDHSKWSNDVYQLLNVKPHSIEATLESYLRFVPKEQKKRIREAFELALKNSQASEIEHKIIHLDHTIRYVSLFISPEVIDNGNIAITLLDITTLKQNEMLEAEKFERIERYQDALLEWASVEHENLDSAFEHATELSSRTMSVSRVSIWLHSQEMSSIQCRDLYIKDKGHFKGYELYRIDYPNYFTAMQGGKIMAINQARIDSRTNEFTYDYLEPNNIFSMLDAPILYQGKVVGVVCHEQTGSIRHWSIHEIEFASAIAHTVSLSLEIDKRKQIEHQLVHQAYHDPLTGLPNRTLFADRLEQAMEMANRQRCMLALVFVDLDDFKEINDTLGHAAGDKVLVNVAKKIRESLRRVDTVSRMGGDEFTIILTSINAMEDINGVARKLADVFQEPMYINDSKLSITGSIGISVYPDDGENVDVLLSNADAAMYNAKKNGRNCYSFYNSDMS